MLPYILLLILLFLILGALLIFHLIGKMFLQNLHRKGPGEAFSANIDISFYRNSPVRKLAEKGLALMETLSKEDVTITSIDGLQLHATLFSIDDHPQKFVLGIHGFQSHAWNEFAPHIAWYRSLGFSMLLPDDRAHGYSEGEYITMGVKDRLDCVKWAKYLVARFGPDIKILFHGVSMGGATVLSASGETDLPQQVIGVVSDCGFTCVRESMEVQIHNLVKMPPAVPLTVSAWYAKHRIGFSFEEARPIDQVRHARVPIFFVHGQEDQIVPSYMALQLYEACSSAKRLLIVPHANHAESIAIDPDGYHRTIRDLFQL